MLGIAPLSTLPISTLPDAGVSTPSGSGAFINTANQPQIANYGIVAGIGFFCAALVAGQVPGSNAQEYRHGTHATAIQTAEGLKSTIFRAQVTPPTVASAVPPFIAVQQQAYNEVRPLIIKPQIIGQGKVPAATIAPPQNDPTQTAAQVFKPFTPTAIVPNPIAAFFAIPPQDENRQVSTVWKSQVAGQTPPVIPFVRGAPQDDPSQIAALVIRSSQAAPAVSAEWVPPPVIGLQQIYSDVLPAAIMPSLVAGSLPGANAQEYRWGGHAQATHEAEGLKSTIFRAQVTPPTVASAVPPFIAVQQQAYNEVRPLIIKPQIIGQGKVPAATIAPPQNDPTQTAAQVFKPFTPTAIVPNPIAAFFAIPPQDENRQVSTVWKSQVAGQTPPVIPFVRGAPQDDPSQIAALVIRSSQAAPAVSAEWVPPPVIGLQQIYSDVLPAAIMPSLVAGSLPGANAQEYRWGGHAQATHEAERAKTQVFPAVPTPITVSGDLASFVKAAPQDDPTQIGGQIFKALQAAPDVSYANQHIFEEPQVEIRVTATIFKPPLIGKTPPVITSLFAAPQQADLTQQAVITPISKTQPVFGAVPPLTMGGMPQADTTQIAAFVTVPLEFGIPPPPPPPVSSDVIRNFSLKEWRQWHHPEHEQELRKRGISDAEADAILDIAERQANAESVDNKLRIKELRKEMRARGLAMQVRHITELNNERERLIDAEIRRLMQLQMENDDILLLLAATAFY